MWCYTQNLTRCWKLINRETFTLTTQAKSSSSQTFEKSHWLGFRMYLYELRDFMLKKVGSKSKHIHVVPCDLLPASGFTLPAAIIFNTEPSSSPGLHWQSVYIDEHARATFFCSYGLKPRGREILKFLKKNTKTVEYNTQTLQQTSSFFCGEYCAVFLIHCLIHKTTLKDFLKKFSSNLTLNDKLILKMFSRIKNFSN